MQFDLGNLQPCNGSKPLSPRLFVVTLIRQKRCSVDLFVTAVLDVFLVCLEIMGDGKFSIPEKVQIIKWIYSGSSQNAIVQNLFPASFPQRPILTQSTISYLVKRFEETGSLLTRKRSGRPKTATAEDVSTNIMAAVEIQPHSTSRQLALEQGISQRSVIRILKKSKYHPYTRYSFTTIL